MACVQTGNYDQKNPFDSLHRPRTWFSFGCRLTAPSEFPDIVGALSNTDTEHPARRSACAADKPPMDPPTISTLICFAMMIVVDSRSCKLDNLRFELMLSML